MALWRIVVKNSGNAAYKDKRQRLEKGIFIETRLYHPYYQSTYHEKEQC